MKHHTSRLLVGLFALLAFHGQALGQDDNLENPLRQDQAEAEPLTNRQARLADRYDQLELLAGRLAELSRATQPRRAKLLRELVTKSRERDIAGRFDLIVSALEGDRLGKASKSQQQLQVDLQKLLDLLLQEDRDRQIESERKRIKKYLAELKRLIRNQRGIRSRTEGGDESLELQKDQQSLGNATNNLEEQIKANEGTGDSSENSPQQPNESDKQKDENKSAAQKPDEDSKEGKSNEGKPSAGKPSKAKPSKSGEPSAGKPSEAEPQEGQSGEQSQQGQPQQGQPQQGQPQQGQPQQGQGQPSPSDSKNEQSQSPMERAQQRLQKAQQRMKQALEQLEEAKRENAIERQEQAIRELEQAKAELERILRQLREEELERMLVLLEARFRKMLDAQVEVYEQTKKLDASQTSVPEHEVEIASGRLDRKERLIVREADRALVLLREDGTTVAFPEAIEQARDDMKRVAKRLGEVKIGSLTQGIEEDIIAALEETLAALQKALKELREQQGQPQQQQQGRPGEKPLVDQLAELRMIRALQNRINRRTERYGEILGDDFAVDPDLLEALDELAVRQERIFEATRDLDSGRNQ